MIERWFEPFTLLAPRLIPDGLGSQRMTFEPSLSFQGALTHIPGEEADMAGKITLRRDPVLLHEFDVTLVPGDRVRRERDGEVYRVAGRSGDMRTPAFSGLRFAQVPVERWCAEC